MSDDVRRVRGGEKTIGGDRIFYEDQDGGNVVMPWEEYERLRARIEEQNQIIKEYCLEEKTGEYLLGRIEELEKRDAGIPFHRCRNGVERVGSKDACEECSGVFIPYDRIDAAFSYCNIGSPHYEILTEVFGELGIVDDGEGGWKMSENKKGSE